MTEEKSINRETAERRESGPKLRVFRVSLLAGCLLLFLALPPIQIATYHRTTGALWKSVRAGNENETNLLQIVLGLQSNCIETAETLNTNTVSTVKVMMLYQDLARRVERLEERRSRTMAQE